jgi:hypothetical protein
LRNISLLYRERRDCGAGGGVSAMRKTLIATVALLLAAPALAGSPTPRLPHLYAWAWCVGGPRPYFECDYTSRTCLQGRIFGMRGGFVGVVLAEDRHTVLAHLWCTDPHLCINLDTGEGFADNRHVPQLDRQQDIDPTHIESGLAERCKTDLPPQ